MLTHSARPLVYLALELSTPHVNINVHPTKKEVVVLHDDRLCEALASAAEEALGGEQMSRNFTAQAILPVATRGGGCTRGGAPWKKNRKMTRAA